MQEKKRKNIKIIVKSGNKLRFFPIEERIELAPLLKSNAPFPKEIRNGAF